MMKFLLGLITALTSLCSLFGFNNSALANPVVSPSLKPVFSSVLDKPVNLNVSASLWQLKQQDSKDIFEHLACTCALCVQQVENGN